jgi:N-acyl-D-amino-acid deacylase
MFDLKITGGQVIDGTGCPAFRADVGIQGDSIREIGDLSAAEAKNAVDATGKYICPGFMDVHSHSDAYLLIEPSAPSKIFQGVTTEVVGNCGASAAPRVGRYPMPSDWRDKKYPGPWKTVAEYRKLLDQVKPAVNVVLLIGHNAIRAGIVGYEGRAATDSEFKAMADLLARSLDEGGAGLSTGLIYSPGMFAPLEEIVGLAKVVARRGKIYTSHMRSEGSKLLEAIDETVDIGRQAGVRVQISHLKTSGRKNWHLLDAALVKIRKAQAEGVEVASDRYPYTAACTDLDVILPDWASEGDRDVVLKRLREPQTRKRIRDDLAASRDAQYWESVTVGTTHRPDNRKFQGIPLLQVAKQMSVDPVDAALHLIDTDELHAGGIFFGMNEANMWKILGEPYVMLGSDASVRAPEGPLSNDHPHPRAYGTFPRFLRAALDGKTVRLSEAIRKMTSLPAEQFRLKDRGVLATGKRADVVVFDPAEVRDIATYEKPHQFAKGIDLVVVNGVVTLQDSRLTGRRAGCFLANALSRG